MKNLVFLLCFVILSSCGSSRKTGPGQERFVLENLKDHSSETLKRSFPEAQIQEDTGMFEEGTIERPYSVLFPGGANELHITWKDPSRKRIHDIHVSGEGSWRSEEGIAIGTTYQELNRLNGKEISFYGFGWDYGGAVLWNGGKLEDSGLRVFLAPGEEPPDEFYGDRLIEASEDEIAALDLRVGTLMLVNE